MEVLTWSSQDRLEEIWWERDSARIQGNKGEGNEERKTDRIDYDLLRVCVSGKLVVVLGKSRSCGCVEEEEEKGEAGGGERI